MYRLTLFQIPKNCLPSQLPEPTIRRTYRWGTMWGIFQNGQWTVEKRKQIQMDSYLLEEVTQCSQVQAPPPVVDDVWDEEIVSVNEMEYNGATISVILPSIILKKWCSKYALAIPDIPDGTIPVSAAHTTFHSSIIQNNNSNNNYKHSHNNNSNYKHNHNNYTSHNNNNYNRSNLKQNSSKNQNQYSRKCLIIDD